MWTPLLPLLVGLAAATHQVAGGVDGTSTQSEPAAVEPLPANDLFLDGVLALRFDRSYDRPGTVADVEGTELGDAILVARGRLGGQRFEVAVELDDTGGTTLDRVFVETELDARHHVRLGIVRDPFLFSAFADEDRTVFPWTSRLGREFGSSDAGLELLADYGRVDARLAFTNGTDGTAETRRGTLRVGFHLAGERIELGERPRDGRDGLSAFLAYTDDGAFAEGDAYAAEAHAQLGRHRLFAEWVDAAQGLGDQRGLSATWSTAVERGAGELAVRVEQVRQPERTTIVGAAYARSFVRDVVRAQVAVEHVDGPGGASDGWLLSAGVVLSL